MARDNRFEIMSLNPQAGGIWYVLPADLEAHVETRDGGEYIRLEMGDEELSYEALIPWAVWVELTAYVAGEHLRGQPTPKPEWGDER